MKPTVVRSLFVSCFLTCAAAAQTSAPANPPPPKITLGAGVDYSRGDYGLPTSTTYTSVPLDLSYEDGPWTVSGTVSHVTLKGPATVIGGGGALRPTSQSESGLGDITGSASYRFGAVLDDLNAGFTQRVKFPTASESRGLGTGRTDFYSQFDFYQTIGDVTPFATAGYRVLGHSTRYPLKNGFYFGAGSHFRVSSDTVITATFNWSQRILAGSDPAKSVAGALTHDLDPHWQVVVYALKGFDNASPDYGTGAKINYRF